MFDGLVPGHWEGDLIKGAGNRSAAVTLVGRKTRFVVLAKMDGCGAEAALEALTKKFRRVPLALRKSLTDDQGKEMAHHAELTRRDSIEVFFADPHSPWQRPGNENMKGLVREYLPKGDDLSVFSQGYLNRVAKALNYRPRGLGMKRRGGCGARQGRCRLIHAAKRWFSASGLILVGTAISRSGLSVTVSIGDQSRVWRDQRRGLRSRAWAYSS